MRNKKAVEEFVHHVVLHFIFKLGLAHWNLSLKFKNLQDEDSDKVVMAKVSTTWEYKEIIVAVDSEMLLKQKVGKKEIASTIAHELLHVKNDVGFDLAKWVFDKLTTVVAERNNSDMEYSPLIQEEIERLVK